MFTDTKAFSGFLVNDLKKAKHFYEQILGLKVTEESDMNILQLHIRDGHAIVVYEKANHTPATFTILNFPVSDVTATVGKLKELGVMFESYDLPGFKTDDDDVFRQGGPVIAWFTDPAGNILSVIQIED